MGWKAETRGEYPADWKEIAEHVKDRADWRCIRCGHMHQVEGWHILTVHHLNGLKSDCVWHNLLALCQRCHLSIQARVNPDQPYMLEHADWFKVYAAGFYARKYLGESLSRSETEARLDELLKLEAMA